MDKRLEAPERVWIREDRYGIDLEGAYGAKPKDVDCVEYVRADLARSAPEAASAEGSPSHPSGPSQDSQEVREAVHRLLRSYRCQHTKDEDGDAMALLDLLSPGETVAGGLAEIRILADEIAEDIALRFPSPAGVDAGLREAAAEFCDWVDLLQEGHVALRYLYEFRRKLRAALLSQSPKGAAVCGTCGGSRKVDSGGQDGAGNWIERDCPECMSGGPSAPKTGLRGAARQEDGETLDAIRPVIEDIEDSARVAAGGFQGQPTYWTFNVFEDIRKKARALLELLPSKTKPAPGDVGSAGGGQQ